MLKTTDENNRYNPTRVRHRLMTHPLWHKLQPFRAQKVTEDM